MYNDVHIYTYIMSYYFHSFPFYSSIQKSEFPKIIQQMHSNHKCSSIVLVVSSFMFNGFVAIAFPVKIARTQHQTRIQPHWREPTNAICDNTAGQQIHTTDHHCRVQQFEPNGCGFDMFRTQQDAPTSFQITCHGSGTPRHCPE